MINMISNKFAARAARNAFNQSTSEYNKRAAAHLAEMQRITDAHNRKMAELDAELQRLTEKVNRYAHV